MSPDYFVILRETLMHRGILQNTRVMSIDEQLAVFLHTLAHNVTNRVAANWFNHSGATVSRYFHKVLDAVCKVYASYVQFPKNAPTSHPQFLYIQVRAHFFTRIPGIHVWWLSGIFKCCNFEMVAVWDFQMLEF